MAALKEDVLPTSGGICDFENDGYQSNLADLLIGKHIRAGRGSAPALVFKGKPVTYQDLAHAALAFQRKLLPMVSRGDHVAVLLPDCPSFAAAFLGAVAAGAIASPVNPRLALKDLSSLLRRMRP